MIVYVSGPYRGQTDAEIDDHIQHAREVAIKLWESGHVALCPHLNTAHFEKDCACPDDRYLAGDLELLACCDAIVMTPDWETSAGAIDEYVLAKFLEMPIYVFPDIPLHDTENSDE